MQTVGELSSASRDLALRRFRLLEPHLEHDRVRALVRIQSTGSLTAVNDHGVTLEDALVAPRMISVIARQVKNGRVKNEDLNVWLVGQENRTDGYKIVLRDDGSQFGLASNGFPHDKIPILVGWYGDLLTTFLGM
jgi:hypothetical protein